MIYNICVYSVVNIFVDDVYLFFNPFQAIYYVSIVTTYNNSRRIIHVPICLYELCIHK